MVWGQVSHLRRARERQQERHQQRGKPANRRRNQQAEAALWKGRGGNVAVCTRLLRHSIHQAKDPQSLSVAFMVGIITSVRREQVGKERLISQRTHTVRCVQAVKV